MLLRMSPALTQRPTFRHARSLRDVRTFLESSRRKAFSKRSHFVDTVYLADDADGLSLLHANLLYCTVRTLTFQRGWQWIGTAATDVCISNVASDLVRRGSNNIPKRGLRSGRDTVQFFVFRFLNVPSFECKDCIPPLWLDRTFK